MHQCLLLQRVQVWVGVTPGQASPAALSPAASAGMGLPPESLALPSSTMLAEMHYELHLQGCAHLRLDSLCFALHVAASEPEQSSCTCQQPHLQRHPELALQCLKLPARPIMHDREPPGCQNCSEGSFHLQSQHCQALPLLPAVPLLSTRAELNSQS